MYKELKDKTQHLVEMCETLECFVKPHIIGNCQNADTEELGEIIDMIKDLCCAKKDCYEAAYYEKVIEAMEEKHDEWPESESAGYNYNRYASGRYASKGHGNMTRGYTDMPMRDWEAMYPNLGLLPGGYTDSKSNSSNMNRGSGNNMGGYRPTDAEMESMAHDMMTRDKEYARGINYKNYANSRRHFSETHSAADKHNMDEHAKKHVMEMYDSVKEMYKEADPELRRDMKESLSKLMSDLM